MITYLKITHNFGLEGVVRALNELPAVKSAEIIEPVSREQVIRELMDETRDEVIFSPIASEKYDNAMIANRWLEKQLKLEVVK